MNKWIALIIVGLLLGAWFPPQGRAQSPVVRAVLFFSPTCPHCHKVINEDLPPLQEKYGDQLLIFGVDVTKAEGDSLYQASIDTFHIPRERRGVPTLIVGDSVLVGSDEIPASLPRIIDQALQQGGIDWPAIPGLGPYLEAHGYQPPDPARMTLLARFSLDPLGNSLAVIVLVGMVASMILTMFAFFQGIKLPPWPGWVTPLLVVVGLLVAGYLTYTEVSHAPAVCGPVGDCNTVQQSKYAHILGIPVGALGLIGYGITGLLWAGHSYGENTLADYCALFLWAAVLTGTVFSVYLTFLEPFVIGATCAWCLSSAIVMTILMWAATVPARQAWDRIKLRISEQ